MSRILHRICLSVFVLVAGGFSLGAIAATASPPAEVTAIESIQLDSVSRVHADTLYDRAILEYGAPDKVIQALSKNASDKQLPRRQRVNALLLSSNLHWRHGQPGMALEVVKRALSIETSADAMLQQARLLDATGETEAAEQRYKSALRLLESATEKMSVRLRLAMIQVAKGDPQALIELALRQDQGFRNRVATALALLGHDDEAIVLFQVTSTDSGERFLEQIRLAGWALRAGSVQLAREQAWQAVQTTVSVKDRLYGLSILVESYRSDDELDQLIARLMKEENMTPEARRVLTDLLRESGRYEEALTVFAANGANELTPELRRELIGIYTEAGQDGAIVAEYRKLIAEEPTALAGYEGLGEYLMSVGKPVEARQVWEDFVQTNEDNVSVLLDGAAVMARIGFDAIAIESMEKHVNNSRNTAAILFFEFDTHLEKGRVTDAESALARLDEALPPLAKQRVYLADSYERLNQPQKALAVWETLLESTGALGYDEEVRLASLYDKLDNKEKALETWRSLWGRVTMPARRNFIEERMMSVAASLGRLDDMAIELENKLANKTASRNDSSLLIRIYLRLADTDSAIKVIQKYFDDDDEVEALDEQADVYLLLSDFKNYKRVIERLAEIDTENKADYLRKLILSEIGQIEKDGINTKSVDNIRKLLSQLREIDQETVGGEFEAGVLVLIELDEEAIEAYRRATAESPSQSGSYLLMGDLLKKRGRVAEARATYQYLIEANGQNVQFVAGIDGVMNMMPAQRQVNSGDRTLEWTRRLILERLIERTDEAYLYQALSDVAEEMDDDAAYIAVVENTLTLKGVSRSGALRRLIRFTGPDDAESDRMETSQRDVNLEAHLIYGRRLVALNEEFPPSVYLDLGEIFLDLKDPQSAAKAFNMAQDITGRRNIREQAGQRFEQAGYDRLAVGQYVRALITDSSSIPTMHKLARLRERLGQGSEANGLYVQALRTLMMRQPAIIQTDQEPEQETEAPSPFTFLGAGGAGRKDQSVTYEFHDRYKPLLGGVLSTWPDEPVSERENWVVFEDMLTIELKRIVEGDGGDTLDKFRAYSRLDRMSRLFRRLAFSLGRVDLADRLDARLLAHFSSDSDFLERLVNGRMDWGLDNSAGVIAAQTSGDPSEAYKRARSQPLVSSGDLTLLTDEALVAARKSKSFDYALNLSILSGDSSRMLAVARAWAESENELRSGNYLSALKWGKARLSARQYRELSRYVAQIIRNDGNVFQTLYGQLGFLIEIEAVTGEPVFSATQLIKMLKEDGATAGTVDLKFFLRPQSSGEIISLLETVVAETRWAESLGLVGKIWSELLTRPLTPKVSEQLADLIVRQLEKVRVDPGSRSQSGSPSGMILVMPGGGVRSEVANSFFPLDVDKSNVALAAKVARYWYDKSAEAVDYYTPILLLRDGKTQAAADAFIGVELAAAASDAADHQHLREILFSYRRTFLPAYGAEIRAALDAREDNALSPELTELRFKLFFSGDDVDPTERLAFLEEARSKHPNDPKYLLRLYHIYKEQGLALDSLDIFHSLLSIAPTDMVYRIALFEALKKLELPIRALELSEESPEDLRRPGLAREIYERESQDQMAPMGFSGGVGFSSGFSVATGAKDTALSLLSAEVSVAQSLFVDNSVSAKLLGQIVLAVNAADTVKVRSLLRTLWQRELQRKSDQEALGEELSASGIWTATWPTENEHAGQELSDFDQFIGVIEASGRPAEQRKLLDVITQYDFSVEEFEAYLRVMDATDSRTLTLFVPHLAKAYRVHGLADQKQASLTALLKDGKADFRDFTLWLHLLDAGAEAPSPAIVALLDEWSMRYSRLSEQQLTLMARAYARAGRTQRAVTMYRDLAAKTLKSDASSGQSFSFGPSLGSSSGEKFLTAIALVDVVTENLSGQDVVAVIEDVIKLAKPVDSGDRISSEAYKRFFMMTWQRALGTTQALPVILENIGIPDDKWSIGNLVELSSLYARAGQVSPALEVLKRVVQKKSRGASMPDPFNFLDDSAPGLFGLRTGTLNSDDPLALSGNLFPAPENSWAGSEDWLRRAAAGLGEWAKESDVDADRATRLMLVVAYRLHQAGEQGAVESLLANVSRILAEKGRVLEPTTALAITIAEKIDRPLDLDLMTGLLRDGRLSIGQINDLLRRTSETRGASEVSALGDAVVKYTKSEMLLNQLIQAADDSGEQVRAERWRKLRKDAAEARKELQPSDS